ncbi:hypothetical protein NPIL_435391 [Nephila pilipes]|uniref:Zinc finger PHD-type domain-containing protein n=1 Tax=Nephila pilipes TaxID=299642 RepID=A0A8X6R2G1_NEPPI|nr:hypothetical protein NPIL_435391 [Nephila pilipes]
MDMFPAVSEFICDICTYVNMCDDNGLVPFIFCKYCPKIAHKCCVIQNSDGQWTCSPCSINGDKCIEMLSLDIKYDCNICGFGNMFDVSGMVEWVSCEAPDCNKTAHKTCITLQNENTSGKYLCTDCFNAMNGN